MLIAKTKTVIAAQCGRTSGINWVCGYKLVIDTTNKKIIKVERPHFSWSNQDLRIDALRLETVEYVCDEYGEEVPVDLPAPQVGDDAPEGWSEWRA